MSYQLTIEPLGETISVDDSQTVLDACLRNGIYLPYACGHGLCGTCKVAVLDGDVDLGNASSFALLDFERMQATRWRAVRGYARMRRSRPMSTTNPTPCATRSAISSGASRRSSGRRPTSR